MCSITMRGGRAEKDKQIFFSSVRTISVLRGSGEDLHVKEEILAEAMAKTAKT